MKIKSFLLAGFAAVSLTAAADVDLKNAVIVHPDTMQGWEQDAVDDMKTALEKITGKTYKVQPESKAPASGVKIYIGNTKAAAKAGIKVQKMEPQQFRMKAGNNAVYLAGGRPTGTRYAVITFLQTKFGVYWLAGDCQVYPKNANPVVADFDKTQKPDIPEREIYSQLDRMFAPEVQKKWHLFNRMNRLIWPREDRITPGFQITRSIRKHHTFYQILPPKKFFKDHPEYYSMRKTGQRDWQGRGQLCMTNREMWKETVRQMLKIIEADRKNNPENPPTLYSLSNEDNPNELCFCPACKARAEEGGGQFTLIVDYVNYVAREIRKRYPDVWISTGANSSASKQDKIEKLESNVVLYHADKTSLSVPLYPLTDPMNKAGYDRLKLRRSQSAEMRLWDYFLPTGGQPATEVDAIIGDCCLFRDLKLRTVFKESSFFTGGSFLSFHLLQIWLEAQLLFDASQDAEKLISDFIDGYYGAAAPEIKEYLALLRKAQNEKRTSLEDWTKNAAAENFAHVTPEFLSKSRELVLRGLEKVREDKKIAARVAYELISIDKSSFRYYGGDPGKEEKFKKLKDEYRNAVLLVLDDMQLKPDRAAKLKRGLESVLGEGKSVVFKDLPPELASIPASQLVPVTSSCLKGHPPANTRGTVDPESSQPKSIVKRPMAGTKKFLPVVIGVSSRVSGAGTSTRIKKAPADEKYHWYKIGTISIDSNSWIHVGWTIKLLLKDFYTEPQPGAASDPNRYEVWVSIRMQGPDYVPGSKKETGLYVDRGLLVRKP